MIRTRTSSRPALLAGLAAGACLAGLAAPVLAQTPREQQLEARVTELERLVKQLLAQQSAANAGAAASIAAAASAAPAPSIAAPAAATSVAAGPAPAPPATILPNAAPGTRFLVTGFVKADALWTGTSDGELADGTPGRDFYVPGATPVGGAEAGTDLNSHVKQTRLILGVDSPLGGADVLRARVEMDFFGYAAANPQRVTNPYGLQLRHAFVQWREWLVGQTWSNFEDVAALPETVDFIGPTDGTVFVRQPQVRWTRGGFSASLENPETTFNTPGSTVQLSTDDSTLPDLVARYTWKGDWGHFTAAGLVRELRHETTGANAFDAKTGAFAGSLSGRFNFGRDDVRFVLVGGNLGRYVGLNFANDAVLAGGELEAIDGVAGFVAYRHVFTSALRTNLSFAMQRYDNDARLTAAGANKASRSFSVNLIYTPLPQLDVGAEFRHATRELESGAEGDLNRLQFTTRYSF